ncbi:hypothetical protein [Jiella marina]|uniref:hypothetical protein n=1 Tax=Jiella sp. LLJ827 TaxID=2917712 RepID=UPI002100C207|nr:hypothetical protein [Jiella sp. LLJ827]MCQ0986430.1 hypothetical protein [Jiella sp. LLJ827]
MGRRDSCGNHPRHPHPEVRPQGASKGEGSRAHTTLPEGKAIPDVSETAERMAAVMIERASIAGACTDAELIEAGFTPHDLARDAETARQLAYGQSERRVS